MKNEGFKIAPVLGCIVTMLSVGIVYMWNVFQQPVMDYYGWEKTAVSFISAINILMFVTGIFIGGILVDKLGPRPVNLVSGVLFGLGMILTSMLPTGMPQLIYITYGVMAGTGVGLAYAGATNCLQKWFPTRRGFASSLASGAFGTSIVTCVPIAKALLAVSVSHAFKTFGIVLGAIVILCSFLLITPPEGYMSTKFSQKPTDTNPYSFKEALGDKRFWFMCAALFFGTMPYLVINPIVQTLGAERGISSEILTATSMIVGVGSAVSRFAIPTISDKIGRAKAMELMFILAFAGSILMIFAKGLLYPLVIFLIVCAYSGPAGIYPAMTGDAFGMKNTGTIFGAAFIMLGFSSIFTTWLVGIISKISGGYTWCFIIAAAFTLIPVYCMHIYDKVAIEMEAKR